MTKYHWWVVVACVVAFTVCVCIVICTAPARIERVVQDEAAATRQLINDHANSIREDAIAAVNQQGNALRVQTLAEVRHAVDLSGSKIDNAISEVGAWRTATDKRVGEAFDGISQLQQQVATVIQNANHVSSLVDQVATENLVCKGNGNCWPSRITAIMGGASMFLGEGAQAARRFDAALPQFIDIGLKAGNSFTNTAESFAGIAKDTHTFTSKFVAPKPWYSRMWEGTKTLGTIGGLIAK